MSARPLRMARSARLARWAAGGILGVSLSALAGCGGAAVTANPANQIFSIGPVSAQVDTNCAGCNAVSTRGAAVQQFSATLNTGNPAEVEWSVSGGDAVAGAGTISATGQYTPPTYLTADRVPVIVTAALKSDLAVRATSVLVVTPGFLQPLTPQNAALGPGGSLTVSGVLAEAGGDASIHFALAGASGGSSGGVGTLSAESCQHSAKAFTTCTVTYIAPSLVSGTSVTYLVATAGGAASRVEAPILLNAAGVESNPAMHQGQLAAPAFLGSSGGNNNDYDAHGNSVQDCCSGTLGALVVDNHGQQYILSNNHVLARSDQAHVGDAIIQPGLIDNNCTPNGAGAGTAPVAALSAWLPLHAGQTNVDAAIAEVGSHSVDTSGSILELGARNADGTLAAAPPGTSSTGGKGETAGLRMRVAKSGRTTGLTCGGVSAIAVDVAVEYFRDCAETRPYLTKLFSNQIGVSGNHFSDAGDSGALVVDADNAEPVGLYFAGGTDAQGVGQGVANPASDVLSALGTQAGGSFSFVGGADHAVSCLSFGDRSVTGAQDRALSRMEIARLQPALMAARAMVNASNGIFGVSMGKSSDHAGEAAVVVYANEGASVPASIGGLRTVVVITDARAVALGTAPTANLSFGEIAISATTLNQALAVKRQVARGLMQRTPAFFGVGVGQSLDNPREAALVIYVDRNRVPARLPAVIGGLRTRYIVMDRLHVTRSFATPHPSTRHCLPRAVAADPLDSLRVPSLGLF